MSTQENGNAGNTVASLPAAVNIVSSTNTNPIVVTATAHGLTTGDKVSINKHEVNTSANGTWSATVLTVNTYSIPVAGVGVGGATGTSQSLACGATYAIPSDGDAIAAASVNVALEALGDRTAFLTENLGASKLVDDTGAELSTDSNVQWDHWAPSALTDGIWNSPAGGTFWQVASSIQVGDLVVVEFDCSINLSQTAEKFNGFSLQYGIAPPGLSSPAPITLPASQRTISVGQFVNNECHPVHFAGKFTAATAGTLNLEMACNPVDHASLVVVSLIGSYFLRVTVTRPTGMPQ